VLRAGARGREKGKAIMASEKQLEANRRNALRSTGPRTPEGKAVAAGNALKHGLCSGQIVVPGEAEDEYEQFAAALMEQLAPAGALEAVFAAGAVQAAWRLRRAVRLEQELMEADFERGASGRTGLGGKLSGPLAQTDKYGRLCRYEAHLQRALYRALRELRGLQAVRAGQADSSEMGADLGADANQGK